MLISLWTDITRTDPCAMWSIRAYTNARGNAPCVLAAIIRRLLYSSQLHRRGSQLSANPLVFCFVSRTRPSVRDDLNRRPLTVTWHHPVANHERSQPLLVSALCLLE